ncbi:hypothetical protein FB384_002354 [Prauserella sediminis]|uniref:DUF742 domain-containing protein n=1 Tax=Prauserella sediminis TaxID=577680 RepID=A0A839XJH8_9PSEU|nr:DUF742 domain-containing protein [Prauserella sediminis]MBB3663450.1 hypothetical protein [Prauserella sediminis]
MTPTHEWDPSDWDALHQGGQREHDSPDRFDLGSLPRQLPPGRSPSGRHSAERFPPPQQPPGSFPAERFPSEQFPPEQFPPEDPSASFPPEQFPPEQFPPEQFPPESRPPAPRRSSSSPSFPPASRADMPEGRGRGASRPAGPRRMHRSLVRPYARTGGRVAPATDLQLESLVSAGDVAGAIASGAVASTVQRFICDLCAEEVKSIAEIAAYARLPLGVVKVIVSDLADAGAVSIQRPGMVTGDRSSQAFMERILEGLKAL